MKRKILIGLAALAVLLVGALALGQDRLVDHVIRQRLQQKPDQAYLARDGRVRVLLCGTGSPEVSAAQAQACTLVAAGGKLFLFDVGDGAVHALAQDKVPVNQLTRAFITHYHSDHFGDLGPLINSSWIWGRKIPLEIQGPVGMNQVLAGITQAYALDEGYRAANMPHLNAARAVARGVPMEIQFPAGQNTVRVYDQDGVTVDANVVVHDPVKPALGYTISYAGKKVFVSGDTEISPVYFDAMKGADLVVHEAYATHMVRRAIPQLRAGPQFRSRSDRADDCLSRRHRRPGQAGRTGGREAPRPHPPDPLPRWLPGPPPLRGRDQRSLSRQADRRRGRDADRPVTRRHLPSGADQP